MCISLGLLFVTKIIFSLFVAITQEPNYYAVVENQQCDIGGCITRKLNNSLGFISSLYPVLIPGPSNIMSIACGTNHLAVITTEGEVYSMGEYYPDNLGPGHLQDRVKLTKIPNLSNIVRIYCGYNNIVAISSEGKLYVYGFTHLEDKSISQHYNRINKIVLTTTITDLIVDDSSRPTN